MHEYGAPLLAFIAALIALRGGTWNKRAKGIRRITRMGWFTLSLALLSCAVTIGQVYQDRAKSSALASERHRMKQLAYSRLGIALIEVLSPLALADQVNSGRAIVPE